MGMGMGMGMGMMVMMMMMMMMMFKPLKMKGFPDSHGPSGPLDRAEAIRQPWRSQWAAMRSRQPRRNCLAWFAAFAVLVCLLCLAWRAEPKKEEIQKMIMDYPWIIHGLSMDNSWIKYG
jgi:hypothetical protein